MDRFTVERMVGDRLRQESQAGHKPVDPIHSCMGNREPASDAGGSQLFALEDIAQVPLLLLGCPLLMLGDGLRQFAKRLFARAGVHVQDTDVRFEIVPPRDRYQRRYPQVGSAGLADQLVRRSGHIHFRGCLARCAGDGKPVRVGIGRVHRR